MSRDFDILAGASIVDLDEGVSYKYYGYVRSEGSWVIMRLNSAETEIRYAVGGFDLATAWTERTSQLYKRADEYKY